MVIEAEVQIKKQILLKIIDEDVEGFLHDLDYLFKDFDSDIAEAMKKIQPEISWKAPFIDLVNILSTLYKTWLEVKQQL